ncbi:tRNA (N6-threonylcarbamoyladenosine(37)-N6)-methyltransferase TrmO|uniref:tRNA-Thr(GGU) m(6)t(6)A37 methyltransferase TsaA n=1 Tax=Dendrosporobacter quercicolus TaxID=146817 RepID=A0A1G9S4K4_9FIRM|nr:tRNA (N6-threonylcarbamoyladenosine(37)-N6)-methyltransferase TrmO [Dendrosporobacter quercicolus]NSL49467.1 tRNA (N6-threonylcarbamoyladenosine(37)-N6)-methyltransferase TrmO [Dendrosporobacter quercicolus DSM 1736]SDM30406.1 tRNA-Thr(GGU) m(6)t(6)A37 methyltransferase TsaA [Dendrosporobacter quercicolus]
MIQYQPIGIIHSPFTEPKGTPIQPTAASGIPGSIELESRYAEGLKDLAGFSHLILIYHLHLISAAGALLVKPFLDDELHGIFATRAPGRPNPIGFSVVRLTKVAGSRLEICDVDMIDGTPLLDIKPYVPAFDDRQPARIGWFGKNIHKLADTKDDGRFV